MSEEIVGVEIWNKNKYEDEVKVIFERMKAGRL